MAIEAKVHYLMRCRVHRAMAATAVGEPARRAHIELADRYASKVEDVAYQAREPRIPHLAALSANENERWAGK